MKNVHEIEYEIKGKDWEKLLDNSFKKNVKNAKIDGFRKGSIPKDIYIKKMGIETLFRDAMDEGIDLAYKNVIKENKDLVPVVEPSVDIKAIDDKHIIYVFKFITRPEVKLGKYKSLGVKKEKVSVSDEELNNEIKNLQSRFAEIVVKKAGSVEEGNTAIIDFEGIVDGKKLEGGSGENYPLEIGSHTFIPGFEEGLIGMGINEEKELKLKFPENYTEELKNKDVTFKVKVNEIKERILPKLDKEFYEDLGYKDIKTEKEFKDKIKEEIKLRKESQIEDKYINDCLEEAVKNMKADINHEIIHEEIHRMVHQFEDQIKMQGLNLEQYLQFSNMTMDQFEKQLEPEATKRVQSRFLLEEVANVEKFEITDKEAEKEAEEMAKKYGITKEELIQEFGGIEIVKYDIKMRKAIDVIKGE